MKKQRTRGNQKAKRKDAPKVKQAKTMNRRQLLKTAAIGGVALAGVGVFSVRAVRATIHEHDLSRVGQGRPSVVQIHDPQCQLCTALQKQARKALRAFDDDQIDYVIANIRTPEGQVFAGLHGQPHVTLMLFDGNGNVRQVLNGVRQADELQDAFSRLVEASN